MLIAALFTIAKIQKQLKCPLIDGWIKKLIHIHACAHAYVHTHTHTHTHTHRGIFLKHKKKVILSSATMWVSTKGIILIEIS